ncbi:hypothetical protein C8R47DRAFT_1206322 [Mycena vitilis]|nr:hypothetical protein C8R47DRAFT_1206322 [Mycena vitilis]
MAFTSEFPGNSSLPILASAVPSSTKAVVTVITVGIAAALIYYTSPARLTRVLVDAMTTLEKTYLEAFETGLLAASDVSTIGTSLSRLQFKVSEIRQETLHDSRSNWKELCAFLKGRSLAIYRCIQEVHDLETRIEILKETQLCGNDTDPMAARTVSLRRRCVGRRGTLS